MALNLNFLSWAESKPVIGQEIVYLRYGRMLDEVYFKPSTCIVTADVIEFEKGVETGLVFCIESEKEFELVKAECHNKNTAYELRYLIKACPVTSNEIFWMPIEDYWLALEEAEKEVTQHYIKNATYPAH